jgi:anti-sigma regulatory factor (Ser/Thr protein kinase)
MTGVRARGEDIRGYILENIDKTGNQIVKQAAEHFGISRQAVNKHLQRLSGEGAIAATGKTKARTYKLAPLFRWAALYDREPGLAEHVVWRDDIAPRLGAMPDNVLNLWNFAFTEMFNNAIDHAGGSKITVHITKTATTTEMMVFDDGVGIFRKIQKALGLLDERHAVLELSKGKLTTDPANHTGQGIFFTSRAMDRFQIMSGGVFFSHKHGEDEYWILEIPPEEQENGTFVRMRLNNHTARKLRKVFDDYSGVDAGFNKTVVPVHLAQYGDDQLVSRSMAKRLLARVELFKTVVFDFTGVKTIGQAFADEIFRVFQEKHPEIELLAIKTSTDIKRMIERAKGSSPESLDTVADLMKSSGALDPEGS